MRALILVALLVGCAPSGPAKSPFNENCSAVQLADIEKNYTAEVLLACHEYKSFAEVESQCAAYPEIAERYDRVRQEWIDCEGMS